MPSPGPGSVLPRWQWLAQRLVTALRRSSLRTGTGTIHVVTIPGRKSGKPRSTPVSVLTVGGTRFVVGARADADWVRNARAARWAILTYGRQRERVALVELPAQDRAAILREFPRLVPYGVAYFRQLYDLPEDDSAVPDALAGLASLCTVFRLDPAPYSSLQHH